MKESLCSLSPAQNMNNPNQCALPGHSNCQQGGSDTPLNGTCELPAEYVKAITALADGKVDSLFVNDSPEHAKLIATLIIGRSKSGDVPIIYSGSLNHGAFTKALENAQERVRILVDNGRDALSVISKLSDDVKRKIEVRLAQPQNNMYKEASNHFFVSGNAYRYEIDHDSGKAIGNFNDPVKTATLRSLFSSMWELGEGLRVI
jgi:hypothetical protein